MSKKDWDDWPVIVANFPDCPNYDATKDDDTEFVEYMIRSGKRVPGTYYVRRTIVL